MDYSSMSPGLKLMRASLRGPTAALFITLIAFLGCNTSTIPGECLKALEDNNVPRQVIELVKERSAGDLNLIERTAVRLAFEKAGVDDVCGKFAE